MSAGFFLILQHPSLTDTKSNHQHKRTSNGRMQGDSLIGQPSGAGIALIFGYPKTATDRWRMASINWGQFDWFARVA
jgi:hypothetical protein